MVDRQLLTKPAESRDRSFLSTFESKKISILVSCLFVIAISWCSLFYMSSIWYSAGEFSQYCWEKLLQWIGDDPVTLWVYGPIIIMLAINWGIGGVLLLMELTNKPAALVKYKIRVVINEPLDSKKLFKIIMWTLFNQTVMVYLVGYLTLWAIERRGFPPLHELPSLSRIILEILVLAIISEIVFYYAHRMLHIQPIYKHFHKQHHEWQSQLAIAAFYCHPVEQLIENLATLNLGVMILGSHLSILYLYYILGVIDALNNHCGYHFPFFRSPEFHDYHHARFNECYGLLGILDRLHGTDKKFRESVEGKRHSVMLHLVPPRELIPD